jgi:serine protease inhibitor
MPSEQDDVSLMFALPDVSNDGDALRRLEEQLNVETFNQILKKMKPRKLDLKIPLFNHQSGIEFAKM